MKRVLIEVMAERCKCGCDAFFFFTARDGSTDAAATAVPDAAVGDVGAGNRGVVRMVDLAMHFCRKHAEAMSGLRDDAVIYGDAAWELG
jgi:hypothetical protein